MSGAKRFIIGGLLIALALLLLFGLFRFGSIFAFLLIFSWVYESLAINFGLNEWLAKIIAFTPAVFLTIGTGYLLTFNRARFRRGLIFCSIGYLAICVFMYSINKGQAYDPITGKATKCFAVGLVDYEEIPCDWKFHPQTSKPVITDPEIVKEIIKGRAVAENPPKVAQKIKLAADLAFFSVDGKPLMWYYQHPDGRIDLFSTPGHHPQLNTVLQPISPEIVPLLLPKNKHDADKISIFDSANNTGEKTALEIYRDHLIEVKKQLDN